LKIKKGPLSTLDGRKGKMTDDSFLFAGERKEERLLEKGGTVFNRRQFHHRRGKRKKKRGWGEGFFFPTPRGERGGIGHGKGNPRKRKIFSMSFTPGEGRRKGGTDR